MEKTKKKTRKVFRMVAVSSVAFFISMTIVFFSYFKVNEWHTFDASLIVDSAKSSIIYDIDGNEVSIMHSSENRLEIDMDTLPEYVKFAFISAEDTRFYEHGGIDLVRIVGAAVADIKAGGMVQGASTIGQQLIKLSHLSSDKTFERKIEEAYLSICMEHEFSKDEILEMYLNYVYFGGGFYGIEAASRGYFGVSANELSIAQAAQLAGIVKAPSRYAPHLDIERSVSRRNIILNLMLEYGRINTEEYEKALNEECVLNSNIIYQENYFIDYAIEECCDCLNITRNELLSGGYRIYTTLDSKINSSVEQLAADADRFLNGESKTEAAMVVLRTDGSIAGMAGGKEYTSQCFNRSSDMERQPGSLIKPVICYAPALEYYNFTAATLLNNQPMDFDGYSPHNSNDVYTEPVSLRQALEESLNIPAVEVLDYIGLDCGVGFAKKMGIDFEDECISLSLALGGFTFGVSPLEMAGAYNVFASGGSYSEPFSVIYIEKGGETVYAHETNVTQIMCEENAYILTDMLYSTARKGTAKKIGELGIEAAAKTGTNLDADSNVRDAWTAAYTNDYTIAAWLGTDNSRLGFLPEGTTGGNSTCPMIAELLSEIYKENSTHFNVPQGIITLELDKESMKDGEILLATPYMTSEQIISEIFTLETAPTKENRYWQYPSPPEEVGWYFDLNGKPCIYFYADDERFRYCVYRCDANGNSIKITTQTNKKGIVKYNDVGAIPGNSYFYYITTIHPNLAYNGKNLESEPSRKLYVIMEGQ